MFFVHYNAVYHPCEGCLTTVEKSGTLQADTLQGLLQKIENMIVDTMRYKDFEDARYPDSSNEEYFTYSFADIIEGTMMAEGSSQHMIDQFLADTTRDNKILWKIDALKAERKAYDEIVRQRDLETKRNQLARLKKELGEV